MQIFLLESWRSISSTDLQFFDLLLVRHQPDVENHTRGAWCLIQRYVRNLHSHSLVVSRTCANTNKSLTPYHYVSNYILNPELILRSI